MFDAKKIVESYKGALTNKSTAEAFNTAINKYQAWLKREGLNNWLVVEREGVLKYQGWLLARFQNNTALLNRFFVKRIYDEFVLKGAIKTKPFSQLPKIKREWKVRNTGSYNQAHLNELLAAINNLKGNPAVKDMQGRATLICANLVLRWSEVSSLEVNHQYLRWVGKGNKAQQAELTPELKAKLKIVKTTD